MSRFFWANFFSLLLISVAVAQWVCVAWLASSLLGWNAPLFAHFVAPALIYLSNRAIVSRPMPGPGRALRFRRFYTAVAFTSVFGFAFLVVSGALWGAIWAMAYAMGLVGTPDSPATFAETFRIVGTVVLVAVASIMAWGYLIGQRTLWVNRIELPLTGLSNGFDGKTLIQLSDIHLGQFMTADKIGEYVDQVNALAPDVIMITGDITDGLHHAHATFPALGRLNAPLGVFAILGNHDVATGTQDVIAALREHTDFHVLVDDHAVVEHQGDHLHVVGLLDRGHDWARGLKNCEILEGIMDRIDGGSARIVLAHRPDGFDHAASLGTSLMLSGHTHGGQLSVPLGRRRHASIARFMTRYPRGTYREGRSWLHVNLGLGVTGQQVRVATPREITHITLRTESA